MSCSPTPQVRWVTAAALALWHSQGRLFDRFQEHRAIAGCCCCFPVLPVKPAEALLPTQLLPQAAWNASLARWWRVSRFIKP